MRLLVVVGLVAWAGATLVLALMIVPYTTALARDAIRLVPSEQREAAWGLGATRWEVLRMAVLPYARGGITAGAVLSFGRALGETMAVTFVIGNTNLFMGPSLFLPGNSIASALANEFQEASPGLHSGSLMALGLILFLITFIVLAASQLLLLRLRHREGHRT